MEHRTLQLIFTSTKVFNYGNLPLDDDLFSETEMTLYVVASFSGYKEFKIPMNLKGENFRVNFTFEEALLQQDRLTLGLKLCHEYIDTGTVTDLGEVHIPIKQLLDLTDDILHFNHTSYLLRDQSSKNLIGVIDFSYKFNEKFMCSVESSPTPRSRYSRPRRPWKRQERSIPDMLHHLIEKRFLLSLSRKELRTGFRIGILGMLFGFLIGGNMYPVLMNPSREQVVLMLLGLIFRIVICSFMIIISVFSLE